jgi:tetratricopeptide (TPR) repeat protein/predicted Ser/Thr protein kinase
LPAESLVDGLCDQFEAAWKRGTPPRIDDYLDRLDRQSPEQVRRRLLEELATLDLHYRWSTAQQLRDGTRGTAPSLDETQTQPGRSLVLPPLPTLDDYCRLYPVLGPLEELPLALILEEYCVRRGAGTAIDEDGFSRRFGKRAAEVRAALETADAGRTQALRASGPAAAPLKRLGKFDLLELLGKGGMGSVYKARDARLDRIVAIKVPTVCGFDLAAGRQRFQREAQAAARLRHPHICPIYEVGEDAGQMYIAMGYIQGENLKDWARQHRLTARLAVELVAKIARAVHFAHQHGIVHRDLKPANVMIDAETGEPVLMDFGLAKVAAEGGERLTQTGDVMGTPAYMSPEQASGRQELVGPATDVYALGAILFELIAGRPPFEGRAGEVLLKVQTEEPPWLSKLVPRLHRDVVTICMKAMARDLSHRYASAAALGEDLDRFIAGEAILARRESLAGRLARKVRRRPITAALIAAAVLVFALAGIFARTAVRASSTSNLLASIEAGLSAGPWDRRHVEQMEAAASRLEELSPDRAADARWRICRRFSAAIQDEIDQPRIEPEVETMIRGQLACLAERDPEAARPLETRLAARLARWNDLVLLQPPFASWEKWLPADQVERKAGGLYLKEARERGTVGCRQTCEGRVEIEVEFAPAWPAAAELGVVLNQYAGDGYRFVLRRPSAEERAAADSAASSARQLSVLEILRNQTRLARRWLDGPLPAGGPLQVRAWRRDHRLTLQVGQLAPLVVEDAFALPATEAGEFALIWPPGVAVQRLRLARQETPSRTSPLEQGDAWYIQGKWSEALDYYLRATSVTSDRDLGQESQYKAAQCLLALKRDDEAMAQLSQLSEQPGDRWPSQAGFQLWSIMLQRGDTEGADHAFLALSAHPNIAELARCLPSNLREPVYAQCTALRIKELMGDPAHLRKLERLWTFTKVWDENSGVSGIANDLIYGYLGCNELEKATDLAVEVTRSPRFNDLTPNVMFWETYGWAAILRGKAGELYGSFGPWLFREPGKVRPDAPWGLVEYARILAADKKWDEAEGDLRRFLDLDRPSELDQSTRRISDAALMLGFLKQRQGDDAGAMAAWRRGLLMVREPKRDESWTAHLRRTVVGGRHLLYYAMLMSLADDVTPDDARSAIELAADNMAGTGFSTGKLLMSTGVFQEGQRQQDRVQTALRQMWRTPRGRQWARRLVFQETLPKDHLRVTATLAGQQVARQGAFPEGVSPEQEELLWDLGQGLGDEYMAARFGTSQLLVLATVWKGQTLFWPSVAGALKDRPDIRGSLAYLLAHRLLQLNKPQEAARLLQSAAADAKPKTILERLVRSDLDRLKTAAPPR